MQKSEISMNVMKGMIDGVYVGCGRVPVTPATVANKGL